MPFNLRTSPFSAAKAFYSSAWSTMEDGKLLLRYQRFGPAWQLVQRAFQGRTPMEVRKRWVALSGILTRYAGDRRATEAITEGFEPHGPETLLRFPIEHPGPTGFDCLRARLPTFSRRRLKREAGWCEIEQMALQQAFDEYGPNWKFIAKRLHRRLPGECRHFMEHRYGAFADENGVAAQLGIVQRNEKVLDGRTVTIPSAFWTAKE